MKNKKYPVTPDDDMDFFGVSSSNDCTGLIPSGVYDESEYDSYLSLENFSLPKVSREWEK